MTVIDLTKLDDAYGYACDCDDCSLCSACEDAIRSWPATLPVVCDECNGWNGDCVADCPQQKRWEAVRHACPCCGGSTKWAEHSRGNPANRPGLVDCPSRIATARAFEAEKAWFADHPAEQQRVRSLSVAEQIWTFVWNGIPATQVVLYRSDDPNDPIGCATF